MKKLFIILLLGIFMISFSSAFNWTDNTLAAYYKLDGSAGVVVDETGEFDGTNNGAVRDVDGIIIDAFNFTAGNLEYVTIGNPLRASQDFTFNLWFNTTTTAGESTLLGHRDVSSNWRGIAIDNGVVNIVLRSNADGLSQLISSSGFNDGEWHMVTMRYNTTTDNFTMYIDNVFENSSIVDITPDQIDYAIGRTEGFDNAYFNGKIDEVGIWNRSLTVDEISELYNSGSGLPFGVEFGGGITVILDSPLNDTLQSSTVQFNFTLIPQPDFNLTNATIFIWDSNGDLFFTNTTNITGNETNSTFFIVDNLTVDNYEWNVFGSSENATGFLSANFSEFNNTFTWVPFEVDNEVFSLDVFETSRQDFLLNITTLSSVLSVNAILNYNNTRFTADVSCVLGFCQISTAINIPLIPNGEEQNKSFFWEIFIFDGTNSFSTNLTANEQNVTRIHLEECGDVTTQTLNFTVFDEDTEDPIDPFLFDASLQFWLGTGSIKRNNTLSNSSISSMQLCFSPATETLFLDATIEYDEAVGANYTKRNYFFQNDQINNVSQDIKLGLLLAEDSTSFILKVQDRDILPVANVIIFTERFYPGDGVFKVVQVSETDDNGRTVGFFETETVEYRFILKQNGTTVLTTNKQKIVGESVPFTLTFTIGEDEGSSWEPFEPIDDLESEILFNKTTNIISFTYLDTSGDFELGRLIVEKVNASGLQNNIICSETSVQSSATITCNITGNSTGQYIMRGIITRSGTAQLVEQESFSLEDFSTIAGRLGLFLGWFIILISIFTFKFNEVAGIILVNLTIIFVNLIGLISFGYVFISAMIAISIIILVVLER